MGGGARRHHGLTQAQMCQMATLEQLQGSSGPFAADSAADALRVEVTCAARYIRDLESAKMVKKTGRAGDRFARQHKERRGSRGIALQQQFKSGAAPGDWKRGVRRTLHRCRERRFARPEQIARDGANLQLH